MCCIIYTCIYMCVKVFHMYMYMPCRFYLPSLTADSRAIKVWDFQAALDPRAPTESLCVRTLMVTIFISGVYLVRKCSDYRIHLYKLLLFTGALWPSFSSAVWRLPDHQQFARWHNSNLGLSGSCSPWTNGDRTGTAGNSRRTQQRTTTADNASLTGPQH